MDDCSELDDPHGAVGPTTTPVAYEVSNHIATITYNRPERRNAIDAHMRSALDRAWHSALTDEDVWVVIVTGSDPVFCAGVDLKAPEGATGATPGTFWEQPTVHNFESGLELAKPVIAAVNGPCVGYGLTAVLACDFVIASERATFHYPEVKLGMPTIVGAIRLPELVGWQNAMELLLLGDPIGADEAHRMGLVKAVVPHVDLFAEALRLAERLCACSPIAVRATKEVAKRTRHMSWTESVRFGETMRRVALASGDAAEGALARAEGRTPEWPGR